MKLKNYINIILIIIWMLVIFNFSSQNSKESSGISNKIIIKIAEIIKNKELTTNEKEKIINKYKLIIRKGAHFASYFILGILVIVLLIDLKGPTKLSFIITIAFSFFYACSDEIHQLFVPGRHGSFIDVLIDTSGSLVSTSLIYFINNFKSKHIK